MKLTLTQREPWFSWVYPRWLCIARMALGLFITYKGLYYMFTMGNYQTLPYEGMNPMVDLMLYHLVTFIHLVGGIFITLGFRTRVMVLAQLPLVLGGLLMVNSPSKLIVWSTSTEMVVSVIVLMLLVLYLILGSGKFSIDAMKKEKQFS